MLRMFLHIKDGSQKHNATGGTAVQDVPVLSQLVISLHIANFTHLTAPDLPSVIVPLLNTSMRLKFLMGLENIRQICRFD